ncbi:MAG: tetratricopeptide repeat protein [Armatimonadota bacterium]
MTENTSGHEELSEARKRRSIRQRVSALARKAETLASRGLLDSAARRLEEALEMDPSNSGVLLQLAGVRRSQGKLNEAIRLAATAVERSERDVDARQFLLQLYLEAGEYRRAIDCGKSLLKLSPRNLYARDIMGVAYLQLGQLDKALQMTNELIHLDPTDPSNHFKRAVLFQQKGDVARAIREFDRVVDLDPEADIAEEAREAISWLDTFQIRQIVGLAMEDAVFRTKLIRNAEEAAAERGFYLSGMGVATLRHLILEDLLDPSAEPEPPTYH